MIDSTFLQNVTKIGPPERRELGVNHYLLVLVVGIGRRSVHNLHVSGVENPPAHILDFRTRLEKNTQVGVVRFESYPQKVYWDF